MIHEIHEQYHQKLTRQINYCIGTMYDKDQSQNQFHVEQRVLKCRLGKITTILAFYWSNLVDSIDTRVYKNFELRD